ncbi:hypothetical protein ACFQ0M_12005 [Kitasatospora aburaviensis]
MLFHVLYGEQDLDVYVAQLVVDLDGVLNAGAMREAVSALLRRHANLRASFRYEKLSRPVQVIPREVDLPGASSTSPGWTVRPRSGSWSGSPPRTPPTDST